MASTIIPPVRRVNRRKKAIACRKPLLPPDFSDRFLMVHLAGFLSKSVRIAFLESPPNELVR